MRKTTFGFCVLMLSVYPACGYAQTPVDAGILQQQIEMGRKANVPAHSTTIPDITASSENSASASDININVIKFRFEGNTLLDKKELDEAVKSYLNHPISFNELQNAAAAVGELYRTKGWVVRSFIPEQDIKDGTVTIKVIEAKFGKTKIEGDADININKKIDTIVSAQQNNDEPISSKNVDRALLLIDDLPGISVAGRLREGEKYGETDLVLKPTKEAPATGAVIADNAGSRSTGKERAHAFAQVINPLGVGDLTSLYVLGSEGVGFARFEQSVPVGNDGWRVGANASIMRYDLVTWDFKGLDGEGRATNLGLQASYPIIRQRRKNLYFNLNYDQKYFDNSSQGVTSSNYNIKSGTAALKFNLLDQLGGGGSNNAGLEMSFGHLDLRALDGGEDSNLEGNFRKISYNISRNQTLTKDFSFFTALIGQTTPDRRLDSSEMFYLGGSQGVRAYPVSEGGGVEGYTINTELRWNFMPSYQLTGFYDHGYVHNSGSIKSYSLDGAGLAFSWQSESGFNVDAIWAHRIGNNPNPTATGNDQDGSLLKNRFWLTISKRF